MEPERKIEKLLRAYAKKRRADAGDTLKLHPATRRMLQGEAARNAPKPGDEDSSLSPWKLFRPQWALLAGFALIVFFSATLLFPVLTKTKDKSKNVETVSLKQNGMATQIAAKDNNDKLPVALDALTNQRLAEIPVAITVASGNAVAAPPVFGAIKSEASRDESKLADLATVAPPGTSALAANTPAAPAVVLDRLAKTSGAAEFDFAAQTNSVQFAAVASQNLAFSSQNSFKNTIAPARAQSVLANFQLQQNGNAIRVVDADGSVYDGALQPENAVAPGGLVALERAKSDARQDLQQAQNNYFRVAGMNRTLKQNVVFTGNLLAISGTLKTPQQSYGGSNGLVGGGGGQSQSALSNQSSWANSRIAGTAVVADTNNIEVNAVPVAP